MIEQLHWSNDPVGDAAALAFFRQHPKGVQVTLGIESVERMQVATLGGASQDHLLITTGDNVTRWCSAGKHWVFDGQRFAAELCTDACAQVA